MFARVLPGDRTHLEIVVPSNDTIRKELVAKDTFLATLPYWRDVSNLTNYIILPDSTSHDLTPKCGLSMVDRYYVQYSCSAADPDYVKIYGENWFTDSNIVKMLEIPGVVVKE